MTNPFHEGELAVQVQAGVQYMASRVGRGIRESLGEGWGDFLREQSMAGVGSLDSSGRAWASVLIDKPGFLNTINPSTIQIDTRPISGDPLAQNLSTGRPLGLVAINLATRERMRINGHVQRSPDGAIQLSVEEAFANCPKYIQSRQVESVQPVTDDPRSALHTTALTLTQQAWIAQSDTFFIATAHADRGVDVSHRGGNPGFVHVIDTSRIEFPDYSGNKMFQTLGNLAADPRAGLVFVGFEQGYTLQLTGDATIDWNESHAARYPGAERVVTFHVQKAVEIAQAIPVRFRLLERSRYNPDLA